MRKTFITVGAFVIAIATWSQLGAQQEMLSRPGPGSGVTPVAAAQRGDWQVAVSNTPSVHVANSVQVQMRGPVFLKNRTYKVTWPNGDEERLTMIAVPDARADRNPDRLPERSPEMAGDGWAEVQTSNGIRRWINILAARSIEEAR